ncbi:MAG TPA: ATPase domain-containing protein, partial [Polyangiaceae bacterium]
MSNSSAIIGLVALVCEARRELWQQARDSGTTAACDELPIALDEALAWERRWQARLVAYIEQQSSIAQDDLQSCIRTLSERGLLTCLMNSPRVCGAYGEWSLGARGLSVQLVKTHVLMQAVLSLCPSFAFGRSEHKLQADLAYWILRDLRKKYGLADSAKTLTLLRSVAKRFAALDAEALDGPPRTRGLIELERDLRARESVVERSMGIDLYVDLVLSLEEIDRGRSRIDLTARDEWFNSDFLVSTLFGFRTGIRGFDVLFEGGMALAESAPGRVILIRGSFGCAKTILALSLAVEVARKGGKAAIVPLDDTVNALESYLVSLGLAEGLPIDRDPEHLREECPAGKLTVLYNPRSRK